MNPAQIPPEDRPVRTVVTRRSIQLYFYDRTKKQPPFKVNIPRGQWEQMHRSDKDVRIAHRAF